MIPKFDIPSSLQRLLKAQSGVVTSAQLQQCGVPREPQRRLARGWDSPRKGLFVSGEASWFSAVWAGILAGGERAVVSGAAACHLHGVIPEPEVVQVWLPGITKREFELAGWRIQFRRGARTGRGDPPRTRIVESLLDLARDTDEDSAVMAVTRALGSRLITPQMLAAALGARDRQSHRAVLGSLCESARQGIESVLEWRFHTRVEVPHGLPRIVRQECTPVGRVDCFQPDTGVLIELDGRAFHDDLRDMRRDNRHALLGLTTLRYGWHDVVHEPCLVARQLRDAFQLRGWTGEIRRCSRCRRVEY